MIQWKDILIKAKPDQPGRLMVVAALLLVLSACDEKKTTQPQYIDGFREMAMAVSGDNPRGGGQRVVINTSATEEQIRTAGTRTAVMPDQQDPGGQSHYVEPVFSVLITTFNGSDSYKIAQQRSRELVQRTGLTGFWVNAEDVGDVLYYGRFRNLDKAREQSRYMKGLAKAGQIPAGRLFVVEVAQNKEMGEFDLRRQKDNGYYTLQIAVFADEDRRMAARKAEGYVRKLRGSGITAFYFHSPDMSIVTAGTFDYRQVRLGSGRSGEAGSSFYSEDILDLMQRFPYNLVNGEPIRVLDQETGQQKLQESRLVQIPGSIRETESNDPEERDRGGSSRDPEPVDDGGWTVP